MGYGLIQVCAVHWLPIVLALQFSVYFPIALDKSHAVCSHCVGDVRAPWLGSLSTLTTWGKHQLPATGDPWNKS